MMWEKIGRILLIEGNREWMNSHSAIPTPVHLHGDIFRIFFSTRDLRNRSHGSFVDINLNNPLLPINIAESPVIAPGGLGLFDDSGVSLSCYLREQNLFYFMGWTLPKTVPFSNQIGVARLIENSKLMRHSIMPILGKDEKEPMSFGYPWVLKVNDKFFMWYDTNLEWVNNSTNDYRFILRSAVSDDGIHWKKTYKTNIELREGERAIARPCVLFENNIYKMWYSVNKCGKYSLGYAESSDGLIWVRKDEEVGLHISDSGWDNEEVEYPCIFDHKGIRYMLYNGNSYGKTGLGIARLKV